MAAPSCFADDRLVDEHGALERFDLHIRPILANNCFMCHGGGASEGDLVLDGFTTEEELLEDVELWWAVLRNVRAEIMPPGGLLPPTEEEVRELTEWIYGDVFEIEKENIDPGRVTLRRLNRAEYRNTIRDLMGVDYNTDAEFPPDDTGYGFDNIGDVLSISTLLLEKYVQAAETIVSRAVPTTSRIMPEIDLSGRDFRAVEGSGRGDRISFYDDARVRRTIEIEQPGEYLLTVNVRVDGSFDFDPGECTVVFKVDGNTRFEEEYAWRPNERFEYQFEEQWDAGEYELTFEITSRTPVEERRNRLDFRIDSVVVKGPLDEALWVTPRNYDRFFSRDAPPEGEEELEAYTRETLEKFGSRAFRRPIDERALDQLTEIAKAVYNQPDKTFEEGIGQAMIAMLASPRFLFRIEETEPAYPDELYPLIDEYSLASRLSYFLWSTMPDGELFELAERGELRDNLHEQVQRMLDDSRSDAFIQNFTGQWLQVRDVEHVPINVRAALGLPRRQRGDPFLEFETPLRRDMRRETEAYFEYIVREDRSLLEIIDSDYIFLNERLAEHYGIEDIEVSGNQIQKYQLPEDSPRGGVLTQGAVLTVTSNPTRTSAVKRGLYILENILGTPPPPAPPDIPELEEAEQQFTDREPTMRELMALHSSQPMCKSCHARFDPLGMAFENFNAMGIWRDTEYEQEIDASGQLITGESFNDVYELKTILQNERRLDFYRCIAEKTLTYAIGRGLDYRDELTVDRIVQQLIENEARFSSLLAGIIESPPFQRQRSLTASVAHASQDDPKDQTLSGDEL